MNKSKILIGALLIVYIFYVILQLGNETVIANYLKSLILPIVTLLYFLTVKKKSLFFLLFLVVYAISDLLSFIEPYVSYKVNYYLGNSLYIISYSFLVLEICKSVCVLYIIKNFKVHLFVLTVLNIYIIYVLQVIVNPFVGATNQFYVEIVYNLVMLMTLSLALVNYFYRDNLKSLYLFLGSLCIVFSEVIWVAYIYLSASTFLNIISISLFVLSFYFFYAQSNLSNRKRAESADVLMN